MPRPQQERALDWGALIETALTAPGSVGNTYNRFYQYSFLNQMHLLEQGVLEPVATYKRWQEVGRQVLRGSKAYEIIRPIVIEKKNEVTGDVEERKRRYKPVRCLFTYSQTEGEELPPVEISEWSLDTAIGNLAAKQIPYEDLDGNKQGHSRGREFAVNPVAAYPLKTTFHELGHIVLGHTTPESLEQYEEHRGEMEFQAEATSFLVMHELEQITPREASVSRGYIQGWMQNDRPTDLAIRQVFNATDQILKAGRALEGGAPL